MIKLGIIGAENSHSWQIANLCNNMKKVPMRVTGIWGETKAFARNAAEKGSIPNIVTDWRDLAGTVDGVMIDHRHPEPHYEVARFFIEKGIPTFIDKPITYRAKEAAQLFDLAEKNSVPITSFSAKPLMTSFQKFKKQLEKKGPIHALNSAGPASTRSKWGGIFFYGIHQVDAVVELMGTAVKQVFLQENKPNGIATLLYENGAIATIDCLQNQKPCFHWRAFTDQGVHILEDQPDELPYLRSAKVIHKLIAKGESPWSRERIITPIAILEAMEKSLKTKKPVRVTRY